MVAGMQPEIRTPDMMPEQFVVLFRGSPDEDDPAILFEGNAGILPDRGFPHRARLLQGFCNDEGIFFGFKPFNPFREFLPLGIHLFEFPVQIRKAGSRLSCLLIVGLRVFNPVESRVHLDGNACTCKKIVGLIERGSLLP